MAGLSNQGLEIRSLVDVIARLKQRAREIFADQVAPGDVVNTDDNSTIGRMIGVVSPSVADLWEATQQVYDAFNPNAATGVALDNIVAIGGLTRLSELSTIADVYVEGNTNVLLPAGLTVGSSSTGYRFTTTADVELKSDRCIGIGISPSSIDINNTYTVNYRLSTNSAWLTITVATTSNPTIGDIYTAFENEIATKHQAFTTYQKDGRLFIVADTDFQLFDFFVSSNLGLTKVIKTVRVECTEIGPIIQPANSIDSITTPVFGWDSVRNPASATPGRLRETDEQLRERFRNTKFERATNILESLYSSLLSLQDVKTVVIYENDTDVTDANGVLPHSFLVLIDGANDNDIATSIWRNRPTGIRSQGTTSVDIIDAQGFVRTINFSRPVVVNIDIELSISTDSRFPADGEELIRQALIEYVNNLTINEDVVYSRLYTPINTIPGHQVNSLRIGISGEPLGFSNIITAFDQIAKTATANITFV
jgi:uncharacterized phage protein gp47/JayE